MADFGTTGNDNFGGTSGADSYDGLAGADTIGGGEGADSLAGGADNDWIQGQAGDDTIDGGAGSDVAAFVLPQGTLGTLRLIPGSGADAGKIIVQLVDGSTITDVFKVTVSAEGAATVQGFGLAADLGTDTVTNVEQLHFFVPGASQPTTFIGLNLTVVSGAIQNNSAFVNGSGGNDVIDVATIYPGVTTQTGVGVSAGFGNDTITGHDGNNQSLDGGPGNDKISGQGGDDYLIGGQGNDIVDGGTGSNDIAAFQLLPGTTGTLRVVDGATPGELFVELVSTSNVATQIFRVVVSGTSATVEGLGAYAYQGVDSVSNVDQLHFLLPVQNGPATIFTAINLTPYVGPVQNGELFVGGTPSNDVLDLATAPGMTSSVLGVSNGNQGDDTIAGHSGGDDLAGGGGADSLAGLGDYDALRGQGGNDTLDGGAGDDYLVGGPGDDKIDGGAGFDRASFYSDTVGITVDLNNTGAQNTGLGNDTLLNVEHVSGGELSDTLTGNAQDNWLWGSGGGNDKLDGQAGNDLLMVAAGNHTLIGGAGTDAVAVTSAPGGLTLTLTNQISVQATGQGTMTLREIENLSGSAYADTLTGDGSANVLAGYSGADSLAGGGGNDVLLGDGVIDLEGDGVGAITTYDDVAPFGLPGGDDTLTGGAGNDILKGGTGNDRAVFSGARSDYLVTQNQDGSFTIADQRANADGADTVYGVESFSFSDGVVAAGQLLGAGASGDTINGTSADNTLTGGAGNDVISGLGGNDWMAGNGGNDTIDGGDGRDIAGFMLPADTQGTLRVVQGTGGDAGSFIIELVNNGTGVGVFKVTPTGANAATVQGLGPMASYGTDTVTNVEELHFAPAVPSPASNQFVALTLGVRVDAIVGDFGFAEGTIGNDNLSTANLFPAAGANVRLGVNGGFGNDTLTGRDGPEGALDGGAGDDKLIGAGGDDYLIGGLGNDTIDGGAGSNDIASFRLPADTTGSLRLVEGAGADAGSFIVELVNNNVGVGVFKITYTGVGAATVQGIGPMAGMGTDTVTGVEQLHFTPDVVSPPNALFLGVNLTSTGSTNGGLFVQGTLGSDTIDVATFHPTAGDASVGVNGGYGNDLITGHDGPNSALDGGGGDDTLSGLGGADYLVGGTGNDRIDGGVGEDIAAFRLPSNVTGALQVVEGQGGDAGKLLVQNVVSGTATTFFKVTLSANGGAVVEGVGPLSYLGTDTLSGVEHMHFYPDGGSQPFVSIDRTLSVSATFVTGTPGNDVIDLANVSGVNLAGGIGVDGSFGDDTITGHSGNNQPLRGGAGADKLIGGGGDDNLIGGAGNDIVDGGTGNDSAIFELPQGTTGSLRYVLGAAPGELIVELVNNNVGVPVFRVLIGANNTVTVEGLGLAADQGTDTVTNVDRLNFQVPPFNQSQFTSIPLSIQQIVSNGLPITLGSAFNDTLSADQLYPSAGANDLVQLQGGFGDDTLTGSARGDNLFGQPGNDVLSGGGGDDYLSGGAGNDVLDGGAHDAGDRGEIGGDIASFTDATSGVTVDLAITTGQNVGGGLGVDTLINVEGAYGGGFNDTLSGTNGENFLYGGAGDDSLVGRDGHDGLEGGAGDDVLDGGAGDDIAVYSTATSGVTVDLAIAGAQSVGGGLGSDTLISIEELFGSQHGDTLSGGSLGDYIDGREGGDLLRGRAGADTLLGQDGDDTLEGGAGNDVVQGEAGADTVVFSGARADYQVTSNPNGTITLVDTRAGQDGADTVSGVEFFKFSDGVVAAAALGGAVSSVGTPAADTLQGGSGADVISALGGNDWIAGNGGDDVIDGGDGRDIAGFFLPAETTGTLRVVQGTGGDAGSYIVELVNGGVGVGVFKVTATGEGAGTVQGLGTMTGLGTDTVSNIEELHFGIAVQNPGPGQFLALNLGVRVDPIANDFGFAEGTIRGDNLSTASLFPTAGANVRLGVNGGLGNDTLTGRDGPEGALDGGEGDDKLLGMGGDDYMIGGLGNDTVDGGAGANDIASFRLPADTTGSLRLVEGAGADAGSFIVELVSNSVGTGVFKITVTGPGQASVQGLGPMAAMGTDTVTGVEQLHFSPDVANPGPGLFLGVNLVATQGPVTNNRGYVGGTIGADIINLADYYTSTPTLLVGAGGDYGNDVITGRPVDDNALEGGAGDDTLSGLGGADYLIGGAGNDRIDGGTGDDIAAFRLAAGTTGTLQIVEGQSGGLVVQLVQGSTATDVFNVTLSANGGAVVTGVGPMAGLGSDTLSGVEHLHFYPDGGSQPFVSIDRTLNVSGAFVGGTPGDDVIDIATLPGVTLTGQIGADGGLGSDTIIGHDGNNQQLRGGAGADKLMGMGGDDHLVGGAGNDILDGGAGNDLAVFELPTATAGSLRVVEGSGADTGKLIVELVNNNVGVAVFRVTPTGDGAATVEGVGQMASAGADTVTNVETLQFMVPPFNQAQFTTLPLSTRQVVSNGVQVTIGTANGDVINLAQAYPSASPDDITQASGGFGNDTLIGSSHTDFLVGQAGADSLSGGASDDLLIGGAGNDTLDGGANNGVRSFRDEAGGDVASYTDATSGVTVDLSVTTGQSVGGGLGVDTLINIEAVYGSNFGDTLSGDSQDNYLYGGQGDDSLVAGDGNDILEGGQGDDRLDGGAGDDTAVFSAGGTGGVTVDLALTTAQTVGGGLGVDTLTSIENLVGSDFADTVSGTDGANYIDGQAGSDLIRGRGGNDELRGEDGDDTLEGGAGNDSLYGENGSDTALFSGARADYLITANSNGTLTVSDQRNGAPDGSDTVSGVEFLKFNDLTVTVADVGQFLFGGAGADSLVGGANSDTLSGLGGSDTLEGGGGSDRLLGGDDTDILRGQGGDDVLLGEGGSDFLVGGGGNDLIDGGAGINRTSFYGSTVGANVSLLLQGQAQTTGQGNDTLINIQHLTGTAFNDTLVGDANANWLWGTEGSDSLSGGGGDDLLSVGNGAHTLVGGDGVDTVSFFNTSLTGPVNVSLAITTGQNTGQGTMTISSVENLSGTMYGGDTLAGDAGANVLAGWGGSDSLSGGGGNDLLIGDGMVHVDDNGAITTFDDGISDDIPAGADTLNGGLGDDTLLGGRGNDRLDGGDGVDVARFSGARSSYQMALQANGSIVVTDLRNGSPDGADTLSGVETLRFTDGDVAAASIGSNNTGTSANDTLVGTAGADSLSGLGGADVLLGGQGSDLLKGGDGDDGLRGEDGDDTLQGEDGNDFLVGYGGADRLDGGAGYDRAAFSSGATAGVKVDLNVQGVAQDTGQGMDTLVSIEAVSGTRFNDTLTGDAGDNWLWGGSDGSGVTGNDRIFAGEGNDLVQVGTGDHVLAGEGGIDTLSFNGNNSDITSAGVAASLALQGGSQDTRQGAMQLSGFENLSGSAFGDTLAGDTADNTLAGFDGADSLSGGDGSDLLLGDGVISAASPAGTAAAPYLTEDLGTGADTLDGGAGADTLKGGQGDDQLIAGAGNDVLDGGAGVDRVVFAGARSDYLLERRANGDVWVTDQRNGSPDGADTVSGAEYLQFTDGLVVLASGLPGTSASETFLGTFGADTFTGLGGADVLQGLQGNDLLDGGDGNDALTGGEGDDTVQGGAGLDTLYSGTGVDLYDGGAGVDRIVFTGGPAVTVDLQVTGPQVTGQGTKTIVGVEWAFGTAGSDTLAGDGGANLLYTASGGNDSLNGRGGDDLLLVSSGDHIVDGGAGRDSLVMAYGVTDGVTLTLAQPGVAQTTGLGSMTITGIEQVSGTVFADTLTGDAADNRLAGMKGADSLSGGDGNDMLLGDGEITFAGDQFVVLDTPSSTSPSGAMGADTLQGGAGNDTLVGAGGNDVLDGGAGVDTAGFLGSRADYQVVVNTDGTTVVTDLRTNSPDGSDTLSGVEFLKFADATVLLGVNVLGTSAGELISTGGADDTISGVGGSDTLLGGGGNDRLDGGADPDQLRGGDGDDTVIGGDSHDFLAGGAGNDRLDGGDGVDRAAYASNATNGVKVDLAIAGPQNTGQGIDTLVNIEALSGTAFSDTLSGDAGDNWLWGGSDGSGVTGNDNIDGREGNDLIQIGAGTHRVEGGTGTDTLSFQGNGTDITSAGVAFSLASQGVAQTTRQGTVRAGGFENVSGSTFADALTGDANANVLAGYDGADSLSGAGGNDVLLGDGLIHVDPAGLGNSGPTLTIDEQGAGAADTLDGGLGDDTLKGGGGDDVLVGGLGADRLDGGAGLDTATYAAATGTVTVDLAAGSASGAAGADVLVGVERVIGSGFDDALYGDASANTLSGGAGDDVLRGGAGDDRLEGGSNNGVLSIPGGFGGDSAQYSDAASGVTVSLAVTGGQSVGGGLGVDTLVDIENLLGSANGDTLTGNGGENFLYGGGGNDNLVGAGGDDILEGGFGDDVIDGGAGLDVAAFTQATSGLTIDLANANGSQSVGGGLGVDTLVSIEGITGSGFADTLTGTSTANYLSGGGGADSISGGGGSDTLFGGDGADTIAAQSNAGESVTVGLGAGADRLIVAPTIQGGLTVTDFQAGASGDFLDLAGVLTSRTNWNGTANPFEAGYLQLVQSGSDTLVQLNLDAQGDDFVTLLTLQNTSSLLLKQENLGFAPLPRVVGGSAGDTFVFDTSVFTAGTVGSGGEVRAIEVDGGGGTDMLQIVAPTLVGNAVATITPSAPDPITGKQYLMMDLDGDGVADLKLSNVEEVTLNGERVVISGDLSRTGLAPNTIYYNGDSAANLMDASGMTSPESVRATGGDGNDTLRGGLDDDTLKGDDGDDSLQGNGGPDLFEGGAGDDTMDGGAGADVAIFSGVSTDYVITDLGGGVIRVVGPDGTDRLTSIEQLQFDDGTFGQNTAPAGADKSISLLTTSTRVLTLSDFGFSDANGDDLKSVVVTAVPPNGTLTLAGLVVQVGDEISADDIALGDVLFTPDAAGTVTFSFQVKDDGLSGWGTNLDPTANTLTLVVSAPVTGGGDSGGGGGGGGGGVTPVITSGTTGTASADTAIFSGGADSFSAGAGADTVYGGAGDDWLHGNTGDDSLAAGAGDDFAYGGQGNDAITGDTGDDYISGDLGNDTLDGGADDDRVFGGAGDDRVLGGDGDNYIRGGEGSDMVVGGSGFDDAHGNEGDDTVSGGGGDDWVVGGKDNDRLFGETGNDIVYGNLGADTVDGGEGADLIRGGQGDDQVIGGAGDDWLSGDRGDDTLSGGSGADVFHTFADAGVDRVLDFNVAQGDRVQLDPDTVYALSQVGADVVIDMGSGNQMVLVGVQLSSLPTGWIFGD